MIVRARFSRRLPIAAAMLIAGLAGGVSAQPAAESPAHVVVGDLDFANPRDVEQFRRRVDAAAGRLCRREGQLDFHEMSACYRGVRRQCVRQLRDEQRHALLASRGIRIWAGLVD